MKEPTADFGLTKLVAAVISALLALAGWSYSIEVRKEDKSVVEKRLDRIENKVDLIIQQHLEQNRRSR